MWEEECVVLKDFGCGAAVWNSNVQLSQEAQQRKADSAVSLIFQEPFFSSVHFCSRPRIDAEASCQSSGKNGLRFWDAPVTESAIMCRLAPGRFLTSLRTVENQLLRQFSDLFVYYYSEKNKMLLSFEQLVSNDSATRNWGQGKEGGRVCIKSMLIVAIALMSTCHTSLQSWYQ